MAITSKGFLVGEWILLALCFVVVFARLAVRTWHRVWSFWLSEIFLLLALLFFVVLTVGDTYTMAIGKNAFEDYYDEGFAKWKFASLIIFDLGFYLPRFSLLAFYNELFPRNETKLRTRLKLVTVYTACASVATLFVDVFWCGTKVSDNWADSSPECTTADRLEPIFINWSIGIASELLVFALPFGILRMKALKTKDRRALLCIFLLGIATVLVSTARFVLTVHSIWDFSTYLVGSIEVATQIIVITLPALRPLLGVVSRRWSGYLQTRTEQRNSQMLSNVKQNQQAPGTVGSV
ncbi:hypothetical protein CTA1_10305 [Colletotrichum tanaceti]|uniref:Rhodopsin domain-containing protein n=1 Tax=Colletotrichum tanaceti TaxID=1306861 RepID=A0A4U6X622_9PEZI|nr:hypothetical protein CTA1_10305 [Colletotrichum tanaceti]